MTPSPRYIKPLFPNWYRGIDLRSRPKFMPDIKPLSLTNQMRRRIESKLRTGVRA